jgi:hypothetical protein
MELESDIMEERLQNKISSNYSPGQKEDTKLHEDTPEMKDQKRKFYNSMSNIEEHPE